MADAPQTPDLFSPACGCFERVVCFGQVKGTGDAICICLEPGLCYGVHFGDADTPRKIAFSVPDHRVQGDFDWQWIDGVEWTSLTLAHDGVTYRFWVSTPQQPDGLPLGRLEMRGDRTADLELDPASILHDLPFA